MDDLISRSYEDSPFQPAVIWGLLTVLLGFYMYNFEI